ncbi:MAG TPA: hypothetical protein ENN79_08005 [Desulfobacteraceae bacterium]|nr:hypothetical protein [Desulfobacteraceae bacterium]
MPKATEQKIKTAELYADMSLKSLWVDNLHVAIREDDVCFLRWSTSLPEGFFEQARLMSGKKQLKEMIDILCFTTDYYPEKEGLTSKFHQDKVGGKAVARGKK